MEYITAWQCIGCGKIEAPQPCIGVCQDRKVQLVGKADYEAVLAERDELTARLAQVRSSLQRFALAKPHADRWQQTWEALQQELHGLLQTLETAADAAPVVPTGGTGVVSLIAH